MNSSCRKTVITFAFAIFFSFAVYAEDNPSEQYTVQKVTQLKDAFVVVLKVTSNKATHLFSKKSKISLTLQNSHKISYTGILLTSRGALPSNVSGEVSLVNPRGPMDSSKEPNSVFVSCQTAGNLFVERSGWWAMGMRPVVYRYREKPATSYIGDNQWIFSIVFQDVPNASPVPKSMDFFGHTLYLTRSSREKHNKARRTRLLAGNRSTEEPNAHRKSTVTLEGVEMVGGRLVVYIETSASLVRKLNAESKVHLQHDGKEIALSGLLVYKPGLPDEVIKDQKGGVTLRFTPGSKGRIPSDTGALLGPSSGQGSVNIANPTGPLDKAAGGNTILVPRAVIDKDAWLSPGLVQVNLALRALTPTHRDSDGNLHLALVFDAEKQIGGMSLDFLGRTILLDHSRQQKSASTSSPAASTTNHQETEAGPQHNEEDFSSDSDAVRPAATPISAILTHSVSKGEKLETIAAMYGTTISAIKRSNPKVSGDTDLEPGMTIVVPMDE